MDTFVSVLDRGQRVARAREAMVCGDVRLSHAEVGDRLARLAGALSRLGLQAGDRVAILAANCHRYLEVYLAVPASGLVLVPLNTRHTETELAYAVRDSGAKLLFTDREPGSLRPLVEHVVRLPDEYEALVASAARHGFGRDVAPGTLAGLFYTGGTTGASKGVMLTHANLVANARHLLLTSPVGPDDRYAVIAPLFHAAGSVAVLASMWTGACQVPLPAFVAADALDLIEREAITQTLVVPTMLAAMVEEQLHHPRQVSTLRQMGHGGAPVSSEVIRRAVRAFPATSFTHSYGATETAPLATTLVHEETHLDGPRIKSCGLPILGVDVRVVDGDLREVATGTVGEVVVRGPNVMVGYWNKPEQTASALVDGWYRTGDLGYQDGESYLFLVDRAKDMIITGGENVYSTEVEEILYRHPAVLEAAVFGVPHERWGEAVHAVVVTRPGVEASDLIAFCHEHIAGYKVPKVIEFRTDPLPKSGPGKVLKRELRAPYWVGHERTIG